MDEKLKDKQELIKEYTEYEEIHCKSITSFPPCQHKECASTASSVSNIKVKKSSGLLAAFVRRNKKKNKKSETLLKDINVSSQSLKYLPSNSSLGLRIEDDEIRLENIKDASGGDDANKLRNIEEHILATDSEHSIQSTSKSKSHFFRKLIKKQSSENFKKKSENNISNPPGKVNSNESQSCEVCPSKSNQNMARCEHSKNCTFLQTSYIKFGKTALNVTLANGLQSVQELARQFRESEIHLIQILSRYIKDPICQRELNETLSQHSKLQREAERRTSALANDMWMHQIEIGRAQERTLQETLNTLVKQNRQLQIDNEIMFRKHERLVRKLRSFPEMSLKYKCMECSSQIECVIEHNEKLQEKLDAYVEQMGYLENELHILGKQNDGLEQQLRLSSSQLSNLKSIIQRSKVDYELELVTLNYELQKKDQYIRESMESGELLLADIENLKRQFNGLPIAVNWCKIEGQGKYLTDLIQISRSCINELSKELLSLHTQICLKEKEIETLQETNTKLQENLKKSTTELDNMSKKLDESSFQEANKIISEQKCKILESDLKAAQEKIENLKMKFELEKTSILNSVPEYENLTKQVSEKDKMIEHTKMFITNITSENLALRNQVDTLNRSLAESGAGDVVKELANCQDQLAYFQSQYYHLLNEKQMLLNEIETLKDNKSAMASCQEINLSQLRKELQDLEKKYEDKQQAYESEHQTVLSLQHERMKYLEEKNMLRTVFQHMKVEIARVQKLETAVADIGKEASKLAIIAEYNKQIGEKLKSEVHEKDQTILQLRSSVEKLNDIQIQNTKEKLSLCYELSEVCQVKEQLNNILSLEIQKNVALDDKKKEIFETASTQLKKYEELHRSERSALRDLVRDYDLLKNQKQALIKENEKLQREINDVRKAYEDQLQKCESMDSVKKEKEMQISELIAKEKDSIIVVNSLHEKLNLEINKYDLNTKQLEKLIRQLRIEKEELENSMKYLQNNIQKLHNDLNEARRNEKETNDMLNKTVLEKDELKKSITELSEDNGKLAHEVNYLNGLCEKVLSDFESSIKSSVEKEELYKKEINDSKLTVLSHSKEIGHLTETILLKQNEIEKLVGEIKELKQREIRFKESIKSFEHQSQELIDIEYKKKQLENDLGSLRIDHDSAKRLLEDVRMEIRCMQKELLHLKEQKEEDHILYKNNLDDIKRKHEQIIEMSKKEICDLKNSLQDVTKKLENEKSAYATLSEIHKEVSTKFLKSIKSFTDEKTIRQETETKLKDTLYSLSRIKAEKEDLQQQINILLDGLNDEKNRINILTQEKICNETSLHDLQERYNDLLTKCLSLEHQLRGAELGVSSDDVTDTYVKEHLELLQKDSKENHEVILSLKENITNLQQQITALEFQKSEMTLRLHETQRKFETEQGLCEQLKSTQRHILAVVLKMKDEGKVDSEDCNVLLHMVKNEK